MYDSFGDGWNGATYTIYGASGAEEASGGLSAGSFAADTVCLYQFDNFNRIFYNIFNIFCYTFNSKLI